MSDVTVSMELAATPDEVWSIVEPIERHVDWMADAVAIRFHTDQTRGVGTTFDCDTKVGPIRLTDRMEITEWVPATGDTTGRMGVRHTGIVTGSGVFTIEAIGAASGTGGTGGTGGTRFTWSERLQFPWYLGGRLGAMIAGRLVLGVVWRRNLRTLRRVVDDHGAA